MDSKKRGFAGLSDIVEDIEDIDDILIENKPNEEERKKSKKIPAKKKPESANKTENTSGSNETEKKPDKSSSGAWFLMLALFVFVIWLIVQSGDENNSSAKKGTSGYSKSNDYAVAYQASRKDNYYESKPSVSTTTLSTSELRYCAAEKIRLDAANDVLDSYSQYQINKFNNLTDDFNSRCYNKKYYKSDMSKVEREINERRYSIKQDGISRFVKAKKKKNVASTLAEKKKNVASTFTLTVKSDPSDARVRIMNIKPKYYDGISLKKGNYHIQVSKKGYHTIKQWVKLEKNEYFTAVLKKKLSKKNHH